MQRIIEKIILSGKNRKALFCFIVFLFVCAALPFPAAAGMMDKIYLGLGWIIYGIAYAIGKLSTVFIGWLITIASYDEFINVPVVETGWIQIRNLANMFFIVILLVISFATILRVDDEYNIKKLLPKVVLMAVLINFSKTICGIIIEVAQVVMLTFVKALGAGDNNLVNLLGIDKMWTLTKSDPSNLDLSVIAGLIVALIATIIALVIVIALTIMLLMRMIMIWILVVLSPLAYILAAFPQGRKYSSQWWSEFTSNVISGPVMAFFLWLSLSTADATSVALGKGALVASRLNTSNNFGGDVSAFLNGPTLQTYLVTIGMLIGTLIITKQVGGVGAMAAGKAMGVIQAGKGMAIKSLRRRSGYDAVVDTYKGYRSMKEGKRNERIKLASEQFAGVVGNVKQKAANMIIKPAAWTKNRFGGNQWENEAKTHDQNVEKLQGDLADNLLNVKNKKGADGADGAIYTDNGAGGWNKTLGGVMTTIDEHQVINELNNGYRGQIDANLQAAENLRAKQARNDKIAKGAAIIGSTGLGFLTGGLGFAAAGALTSWKVPKAINEAGKEDLKLASNVNSNQISDKRSKLKDASDEDVRKAMNDPAADKYAKAAASLEAMSRKLMELPEVLRTQEKLNSEFKNDKNVKGMFDALAEKNYKGATSTFQNLSDPTKSAGAQRTIRELYESGALSLKDMDSDSLRMTISELSSGMSNSKFTAQFKDLSDSKQASIKNALATHGSYESLEKLAHVTNLDAFNTAGTSVTGFKDRFLKKMSISDLKKVVEEGNAAKIDSYKAGIRNAAGTGMDYTKFQESVQRAMGAVAGTAATSVGNAVRNALS